MTSYRMRPHVTPPRLGVRLLGWLLPDEERLETLGDFEERFRTKVRERGAAAARIWYGFQVLRLVPYLVKDHILWSCIMFRNNLIIAWRNINRSKVYSALNILGLAAGMAVFILIMLYVRYELSFDRYHENARNIYRVIKQEPGAYLGSNLSAVTPAPLAPALIQDFPEVLAAARIKDRPDILINIGEKYFLEKKFYWADPQTFEIFSFPLVRGDRGTVLKDPFAVVLSEREAHRLFGGIDPVGQIIVYHTSDKTFEFKVSGVFRDIPANSHFVMDIIAPFETLTKVENLFWINNWNANSFHIYIRLKDRTDERTLESKLPAFIEKHAGSGQGQFLLQPLTRIHLTSRVNFGLAPTGDARFVFLFASIAVLVLAIACVNYMNLAIARSLKRTKEVGLRKIVGATKGQIIRQFLGDSMTITFLAFLLAVAGVLLALPAFRAFVEREIVFNPLRDMTLLPGLVLLAAAVGAVAGSYPAFFISAFQPVFTLKSAGASRIKGRWLRNGLIVFQFAASIALIVCTVGVRSQLRYIRNKDMGYEREQIVVLPVRQSRSLQANIGAVKTELKRNADVLNVAASLSLPNNINSRTGANWPGKSTSDQIPIFIEFADYDYLDVFGLKIVQGRNFSRACPSDANGAHLINESAQKALGWADPVGGDFGSEGKWVWPPLGKIVGVVRDFHMNSLHNPVVPLDIALAPNIAYFNNLSIKIRGQNIPATLAFIRKTWERFAPEYPFEYTFFDEIFDRAYRAEQRLGTMFSAFAGLTVFIACLGLLGLASFTAEQKTKEIGIRKVLGASTSGVIALLSREFLKWVVLANVIAWPIGYFAMRSWLRNFAYRTSLTVPMFLGAGLAAFAIAAAVIGLQTYRAAAANPADSIRYE